MAIFLRSRSRMSARVRRTIAPFFVLMLSNEFAHLVDGVNAVQVAIALRHAPCEQAMAAQQDAFRAGVCLDGLFDQERQFEAGTLPWNPHDLRSNFSLNSSSFRLPLALAANAIAQSGCRWST